MPCRAGHRADGLITRAEEVGRTLVIEAAAKGSRAVSG